MTKMKESLLVDKKDFLMGLNALAVYLDVLKQALNDAREAYPNDPDMWEDLEEQVIVVEQTHYTLASSCEEFNLINGSDMIN